MSTLCITCKDICQEIHNQYLDKWIYIEQQTEDNVKQSLLQRNTEWLNAERRCLLQSFVQMPTELIPSTIDFQDLYSYFAYVILGIGVPENIHTMFHPYRYLILSGNVDNVWEEDPVPDLTREDFDWVRTMLTQEDEVPPIQRTVCIRVKPGIECSVCYEEVNYERCVTLQCQHPFCMYCIKRLIQDRNQVARCPMCRDPIQTIDVNHDWVVEELQSSNNVG